MTYEILGKMKYLNMTITDSMRLWTPTGATYRIVSKAYTVIISENHKIEFSGQRLYSHISA